MTDKHETERAAAQSNDEKDEGRIPVLYRDGNGNWIMLGDNGEKFEIAMKNSPLERAMSARLTQSATASNLAAQLEAVKEELRLANQGAAVLVDRWNEAEEQLEAARKDAERYRWLRSNCQYGFEDHDGPQLVHRNKETGACQNPRWREDLDAAIDSARSSVEPVESKSEK